MRKYIMMFAAMFTLLFAVSPAEADNKGKIVTSAGVGVVTVVDEELIGNFEGIDDNLYGTSIDLYLTNAQTVGIRAAIATFDNKMYDISGNWKYHFRADKRFVPYAGIGCGIQTIGLVTDGTKGTASIALGAEYSISPRIGLFLESKGITSFDKSTDDKNVRTVFNQVMLGLTVNAR